MLVMFDFAVQQTVYLREAMNQVPSFRPDDEGPAEVQARLAAADLLRAAYVAGKTGLTEAQAARRGAMRLLHEGCVDFAAQARSRYRRVPVVRAQLKGLPVVDRNFHETLARGEATAALWPNLPPTGTPPAAFRYGNGTADVTEADFLGLVADARASDAAIPLAEQAFQKTQAELRVLRAALGDAVSAALAEGKSRYAKGTPEREILDAIPTHPAFRVPGKAVITAATNPAPGVLRLEFTAKRATRYDVFRRVEGEPDWQTVAEGVRAKELELPDAVPGTTYELKVRPRNSRGEGPDSEGVRVEVAG